MLRNLPFLPLAPLRTRKKGEEKAGVGVNQDKDRDQDQGHGDRGQETGAPGILLLPRPPLPHDDPVQDLRAGGGGEGEQEVGLDLEVEVRAAEDEKQKRPSGARKRPRRAARSGAGVPAVPAPLLPCRPAPS